MDETEVIKSFAQTSVSHGSPYVQQQTERQQEISGNVRKRGENIRQGRQMTVLIERCNLEVSFCYSADICLSLMCQQHLRVVRSFQHNLVFSFNKCLIGPVLFVVLLVSAG